MFSRCFWVILYIIRVSRIDMSGGRKIFKGRFGNLRFLREGGQGYNRNGVFQEVLGLILFLGYFFFVFYLIRLFCLEWKFVEVMFLKFISILSGVGNFLGVDQSFFFKEYKGFIIFGEMCFLIRVRILSFLFFLFLKFVKRFL